MLHHGLWITSTKKFFKTENFDLVREKSEMILLLSKTVYLCTNEHKLLLCVKRRCTDLLRLI